MRLPSLVFLSVWVVVLAGCSPNKEGSNYQHVADDDAAMIAAFANAKATAADFVQAFHAQKPGATDFYVKKPYPTPSGSTEHMWIEVTEENHGMLSGIVANDAEETREVKNGQKVTLKLSEISDWKYVDGKKLMGGYTIRYFYDRMTPKEKEEFIRETGLEM